MTGLAITKLCSFNIHCVVFINKHPEMWNRCCNRIVFVSLTVISVDLFAIQLVARLRVFCSTQSYERYRATSGK